MTPPSGTRSIRNLIELDALRGVASLLVVFFHLNGHIGSQLTGDVGTWVNPILAFVVSGHTGVTLFFILSAFLLSLPHVTAGATPAPGDSSKFFRRRALRILPLYWTAVLVGTVATSNQLYDLVRATPYLAFLNGLGVGESMMPWSAVWWSLATEAQFYLLLPLLPIALHSRRRRAIATSLLAILAVLYCLFVTGTARPESSIVSSKLAHSIFGRAPAFLFGISLAWIYQRHGASIRSSLEARRWIRSGGADLLLVVSLFSLGMLLRWVAHVGYRAAELVPGNHFWHVVEALLWACVLFLVLLAPLKVKSLFNSRFLIWTGEVSYSTYIWHYPIILWLVSEARQLLDEIPWGYDIPALIFRVSIVAVVLVASGLSYRVIEVPFLRLKKRIAY